MSKQENWIYDHDEPLSRYSLGVKGDNPLICFGVNPSTAKPGDLDPTVASVARYADEMGYDGWLMFNLYPQRATNPDKMHKRFQKNIHQKNVDVIETLTKNKNGDVWCAWGTLIEKRPYLIRCLTDIYEVMAAGRWNFFRRGKISKAGHPHHPLYLRKTEPQQSFDMPTYLDLLS